MSEGYLRISRMGNVIIDGVFGIGLRLLLGRRGGGGVGVQYGPRMDGWVDT